jgi:hypothetical protein
MNLRPLGYEDSVASNGMTRQFLSGLVTPTVSIDPPGKRCRIDRLARGPAGPGGR